MNLTAKSVNLQKFMIVAYASNTLRYIINACEDECYIMGSGGQA